MMVIDKNKYNKTHIMLGGRTDDVIYRKYKTFPVPTELLEKSGKKKALMVLEHRHAVLEANVEDVIKYNVTSPHPTAVGGTVHHLPFVKWKLLEGDELWLEKLFDDFGWDLE